METYVLYCWHRAHFLALLKKGNWLRSLNLHGISWQRSVLVSFISRNCLFPLIGPKKPQDICLLLYLIFIYFSLFHDVFVSVSETFKCHQATSRNQKTQRPPSSHFYSLHLLLSYVKDNLFFTGAWFCPHTIPLYLWKQQQFY